MARGSNTYGRSAGLPFDKPRGGGSAHTTERDLEEEGHTLTMEGVERKVGVGHLQRGTSRNNAVGRRGNLVALRQQSGRNLIRNRSPKGMILNLVMKVAEPTLQLRLAGWEVRRGLGYELAVRERGVGKLAVDLVAVVADASMKSRESGKEGKGGFRSKSGVSWVTGKLQPLLKRGSDREEHGCF